MLDSIYAFLKSIGYSHPIHPPVTHFPVGLVVATLIFLVVAVVFKKAHMLTTARHVSILAFVFTFPTIIFGIADWLHFYNGAFMPQIVIKIILASVLLVLQIGGMIFGKNIEAKKAPMIIIYVVASVAVIMLGYFGFSILAG